MCVYFMCLTCTQIIITRLSPSLQSLLLIRQEMVVSQKKLGDFCEALKQYLKNVSTQRDCFQ